MPQRSIRFPDDLAARADAEAARLDRSFSWLVKRALEATLIPDDLYAAIKAEAERRGRPHSFSSVLIEWAKIGHAAHGHYADPVAAAETWRLDVAAVGASPRTPATGHVKLCSTCAKNGPPKTRPCRKCGAKA